MESCDVTALNIDGCPFSNYDEPTVDENSCELGRMSHPNLDNPLSTCRDGARQENSEREERLLLAAESGSLDHLQSVLDESECQVSLNVDAKALHDMTALHIAASIGKPDCVAALLRAGANIKASTDAGLTALHVASQHGYVKIVEILLDAKADVDVQTRESSVALHLAAANGHADVVAMLLNYGDDQIYVRNNLGQCPADVSSNIETATLFQNIQRKPSEDNGTDDNYAGRTAFYQEGVLLSNARADVVRRLLHRTSRMKSVDEEEVEGQRGGKSPPRQRAPSTPYTRIRTDDSGIKHVGPESFDILKMLGKGSFGEVYLVRCKETSELYAMKILLKNKVFTANILRYAQTERNVLTYLHHPYIVSMHHAFQTDTQLVLVLQYCSNGNLQDLVNRQKRLHEPLACLYSAEVLLALIHLHEREIVYRDLKPENVVLDDDGHALLTDFGLSKEGVAGLRGAKSFCGSIAFMAPEILQQAGHGHTVDVYGLGVLLYDMVVGMPPFYDSDRNVLFRNIKHAELHIPKNVPRKAASLIQVLLKREPKKRLGADQTANIKKHEFFGSIDFSKLFQREVALPPGATSLLNGPTDWSQFRGTAANPFVSPDKATWRRHFGGTPPAKTAVASQSVDGWDFSEPGV